MGTVTYLKYLFLLALLPTLPGCALVDQFGPRAVVYNEETGDFKSSVILLNVLRAAYREPLQFTDVGTVIGQANSNATLQGQLPIRVGGAPLVGPQILQLTPSAQISGGPQFSTANLNTQEFYQGFQTSIPLKTVAAYLRSGGNKNIVLPLIISEVHVDLDDREDRTVIFRNGGDARSYQAFQNALNDLIRNGLTVEDEDRPEEILSPLLTAAQASHPTFLSGLFRASTATPGSGIKLKKSPRSSSDSGDQSRPSTKSANGVSGNQGDSERSYKPPSKYIEGSSSSLEQQGVATTPNPKEEYGYQVVKPAGSAPRLCFREEVSEFRNSPGVWAVKRTPSVDQNDYIVFSYSEGRPEIRAKFNRNSCADNSETKKDGGGKATGASKQVAKKIRLRLRSVQEIFMFLGEIVRAQVIFNADNAVYSSFYEGNPKYLFHVHRGFTPQASTSVKFRGHIYSIAADP